MNLNTLLDFDIDIQSQIKAYNLNAEVTVQISAQHQCQE